MLLQLNPNQLASQSPSHVISYLVLWMTKIGRFTKKRIMLRFFIFICLLIILYLGGRLKDQMSLLEIT